MRRLDTADAPNQYAVSPIENAEAEARLRLTADGLFRERRRGPLGAPSFDVLIALLAQATRAVADFRQPATGSLSIVASGVPGSYLLPDIVAMFQHTHPGVRVSIELATSARAVESLRSHHAELGVVGGFAAAPEIEAQPLVEDEIVVVGPPKFAGRRMSRQDAESATWISREEGSVGIW